MRFSALQRAEIAEIPLPRSPVRQTGRRFSALQRAEIAEMRSGFLYQLSFESFSALQRAEIAEM